MIAFSDDHAGRVGMFAWPTLRARSTPDCYSQ